MFVAGACRNALVFSVWLGTALALGPGAAVAQVTFYEIAAQPLEAALIEFSEAAQLSLNFSGISLDALQSGGTRGHNSKEASLRSILAGTGLGFKFTSSNSVTIFRPKKVTSVARPQPKEVGTGRGEYIEDLIVTAVKRPETSFSLPVSVSGVSALVLEDIDAYDIQSLAPHLAGVSTTNLGPGRNKIFVRGLSDGPFADRTQAVVGVYIDETPINFNDTNPDIRLYDAERIELVRGPQGTLYGAGSLGGLYRIISSKPVLDETSGKARVAASFTRGGGPSSIVDLVFNTPIVADKLGFRVSAYADIRDGYIDDIELEQKNVNDLDIYGVRPSLRWQIDTGWTLDLVVNYQSIRYDDSQYYLQSLGRNKRDLSLQEPYDDDFIHTSLTLKGKLGSLNLTSATAYVDRTIKETADASEGLPFVDDISEVSGDIFVRGDLAEFGNEEAFLQVFTSDVVAYLTRDDIHTFSHETRIQSEYGRRFQWLLGGYFLHRWQGSDALLALGFIDRNPEIALAEERIETTDDVAVFGEAVYKYSDSLSFTAGLRYSRNSLKLDYVSRFVLDDNEQIITEAKLTEKIIPKIAMRYEWSPEIQAYAQISVGYRVGGININTPLEALAAAEPGDFEVTEFNSRAFQSDELINYELGLKSYWFKRNLSLNVAGFYVDWFDIQSDQIGPSGLPFVTNVGRARSFGYEVEFSARLFSGFDLRGSFFWNDSQLTEGNSFLGAEPGDRLPTIPEVTASIAALYQVDLGNDWRATIAADYAFTGESALTFDEENSPKMGNYGIMNVKIQVFTNNWKLGVYVQNLTDTRANTFSFGNSFTISEGDQITPPRPRTIGFFLERKF